jgi:hypothetical protein
MWNPAILVPFSIFILVAAAEWVVLWRTLGRFQDARRRKRFREACVLFLVATLLGGGLILLGWSPIWGLLMALSMAMHLVMNSARSSRCPSCGAVLSNAEWPEPMTFCYLCGGRLVTPAERDASGVGPSQP